MYTLALMLGKCVATLRGAFFGVFLNETRFFIFGGFMNYERHRIAGCRLFWGILLLLGIVIPCILIAVMIFDNNEVGAVLTIFVASFIEFFILLIFICTLCMKCKAYSYNGYQIVVYAGASQHYIKVNGIKFDEHNTWISYSPIYLNCTLDDGTDVDVTISKSNKIALKINNRLYKETK